MDSAEREADACDSARMGRKEKRLDRVPYGPVPRLLLLGVISEAVQTKDRRLQLGRSHSAFYTGIGTHSIERGGWKAKRNASANRCGGGLHRASHGPHDLRPLRRGAKPVGNVAA